MTTDVDVPTMLDGIAGEQRGNGHTSVTLYDLAAAGVDPMDWISKHREALRATLRTRGAVLVRALPVEVAAFHEAVTMIGGDLLGYTERSTPRSAVAGNIYTSTEYPPDQAIPMHNENSYSDRWPGTLFFFCQTAPSSGGATPVADSRAVLRLMPDDLRERFADGVVYTRTLREGLGLSWQEAFQTEDEAEVAAYCAEHGMSLEWTEDGLRTRQHRPAWRREPYTGEQVWFNQANLFHVDSLEPEVRTALLAIYEEADLPRNAYLADGRRIPGGDLAAVTRVYDEVSFAVPWQAGDVLMVNNMLMAHGRQPFTGNRRILVAMT